MKILIVDDEPLARKRLARLIEEIGRCDIIGAAVNGKDALLVSSETPPDIVLLDIRMPEMDGLETALHLSKLDNPPAIIFTTAYDSHALQAFETNAVDYLLKPIRKERLQKALENAHRLNRAQLVNLSKPEDQTAHTHISAHIRGNMQLIPATDIIYFQAEQKYIKVRYTGGEVLIEDALKTLEENFAGMFLRIHRNALAAIDFISGIEKDNNTGHHYIIFRDIGERLEISRRHLSTVRKALKK
jgi:two-component system response regulator AlgR